MTLSCLFCDNTLNADTKPEHILLNCLGGRETTAKVICSNCNNRLGSEIDSVLCESISFFRTLLNARKGNRQAAPSQRTIDKSGNELIITPDGDIRLLKPFEFNKNEDGSYSFKIMDGDYEKWIPNIAGITGLSKEEVARQIGNPEVERIRPPAINFNTFIDSQEAARSAAKMLLVMLADKISVDSIKNNEFFHPIINFVKCGDADEIPDRYIRDFRDLPITDQVSQKFGDIFNLLQVKTDPDGSVYGIVTIYNIISYSFLLGRNINVKDFSITLISSPIDTSNRFYGETDSDLEIETCFMKDVPDFDPSPMVDRIKTLMKFHYKIMQNKIIDELIREVFAKHGINDGDLITANATNELASVIAKHFVGLPYRL